MKCRSDIIGDYFKRTKNALAETSVLILTLSYKRGLAKTYTHSFLEFITFSEISILYK